MLVSKYLSKLKNLPASQTSLFKKYGTLEHSPNAGLDKHIYDRYMSVPTPEHKTQIMYIWIDGTGLAMRSKTRTLNSTPLNHKECPLWSFNGYESHQCDIRNSDFYLVPVALYNDPLRRGKNKIVLCETFDADEKPTTTNHRQKCVEALNKVCDQEVMFGFEQQYVFMNIDGRPFGWPRGDPVLRESTYAGVGAGRVYGRQIAESFYRSCLYAGIDMFSDCPGTFPAKWQFKTGTTLSIKAGDDLWVARWLLTRIAEDFGVDVSFHPRFSDRWAGSSLHTCFSAKRMRESDGYKHIEEAMKKLEKSQQHQDDHKSCNKAIDNKKPLPTPKFTWGVADRTAAVKIPRSVKSKKKGYFEDRRPHADMDPYKVIHNLVTSILL